MHCRRAVMILIVFVFVCVGDVGRARCQAYPCTTRPCLTVKTGWIVGEIKTVAFGETPSTVIMAELMKQGWVECAGQPASRTELPDLFKAIGDTWGSGDGKTDFYLPDLRGLFLRGWDHAGSQKQLPAFGGDPDATDPKRPRTAPRPEIAAPGTKGHDGDRVGSMQDDAAEQHNHTDTGHKHNVVDSSTKYNEVQIAKDPPRIFALANGGSMAQTGTGQSNLSGPTNPSTGKPVKQATENHPKNAYVMYVIYVGRAVTMDANGLIKGAVADALE